MKDNLKYYVFLEKLQKSSKTNMFESAKYLEEEFDLEEKEAKNITLFWMEHRDSIASGIRDFTKKA